MHYLSIKTSKTRGGEPYMRLVRETVGGPIATDTVVAWSETYRRLGGVNNLVRVLREGKAKWRRMDGARASWLRAGSRNNRILMSGPMAHYEEVDKLLAEVNSIDWANIEVRDERTGK